MNHYKSLPLRQRLRRALLLAALLLFPLTLYYFSPVIVIEGAAVGIVNASLIVFGLMFVAALFVGRLWCGWACPGAAVQELCRPLNDNSGPQGRWNWTKWVIWVPWVAAILFVVYRAGGYRGVDFFYNLEGGLTALQQGPTWVIVYYAVVAVFVGLAVAFGRRTACRTICWMAPFMILGRQLRNLFSWPALRLRSNASRCVDCRRCNQACTQGLDVHTLVHAASMEHSECVLCGSCVDSCPRQVIEFSYSSGS